MPLAQPRTNNSDIAVKRIGVAIPEIAVAAGRLDDQLDVHFGINSNGFNVELDMSVQAQADLAGLGPRILDIKNRGGRTAEDTWFALGDRGPTKTARFRGATPGFQAYFDAFKKGKPIKPGKNVFPAGAKHSGN